MIIQKTENPDPDKDDYAYIEFTYDEELYFAQSVLDILVLPWLDLDDENVFEHIFKSHAKRGSGLTIEDFDWYISWMDRKERNVPKFKLNNKSMRDAIHNVQSKEDFIERKAIEVKRAWKEAWENHPIRTKAYEFFPSLNYEDSLPTSSVLRQQLVDKHINMDYNYWNEVDKVQDEYECSRPEAITLTSDYMKRGNLPKGLKRTDPNPKRFRGTTKQSSEELGVEISL